MLFSFQFIFAYDDFFFLFIYPLPEEISSFFKKKITMVHISNITLLFSRKIALQQASILTRETKLDSAYVGTHTTIYIVVNSIKYY